MEKVAYDQNTQTDLSPDEIKAYKAKYGKVVKIASVDGQYKCYLHAPTRLILDAADSISTKKDRASAYNETIMKNCWLAGDKQMVEEDQYFFGAQKKVNGLVQVKEAELVEL